MARQTPRPIGTLPEEQRKPLTDRARAVVRAMLPDL
jgi:hypothetical protein